VILKEKIRTTLQLIQKASTTLGEANVAIK